MHNFGCKELVIFLLTTQKRVFDIISTQAESLVLRYLREMLGDVEGAFC